MSAFLLSQILASLTLIIGMAAFQLRDRKQILRGWFLAASFAAIHFFLLGSIEAGVLVSVTAIRMLVSSFTTNPRMMWLFLIISVGAYAATYAAPLSLLALGATVIGTIGSFHGSAKAVRYSMMAAEVLWAIHNLIVWSPVALLMEILFFTSNLIGLVRHKRASASAL